VVSAKGEDALALAMRDSARDAGVPVLQDIGLARALLARAEIGIAVPDDLFDAVAQAIVWARSMRERAPKAAVPSESAPASSAPPAPESSPASSRGPAAQDSSREPATRDTKASRPEERAAPRAPRPPPGNPDSTRR
jgi:type III secretion system FlhB-like substrate exporter